MKTWTYKQFPDLYATPPLERLIIGCNGRFRFFHDGNWLKPSEGLEFHSPETGILIRFKNENDLAVLTGKFAPFRIALVVKENAQFIVKLVLLASKPRFIVAADVNEIFNRADAAKTHLWKTTLIVAVPSTDNIVFDVMAMPPGELVQRYALRYDPSVKKFMIPPQLDINASPATAQSNKREPKDQLMLAQVKLDGTDMLIIFRTEMLIIFFFLPGARPVTELFEH